MGTFLGAGQILSRAARRMHSSLTNQRAICSLNYDRFPQKFKLKVFSWSSRLAKLDDVKLMLLLLLLRYCVKLAAALFKNFVWFITHAKRHRLSHSDGWEMEEEVQAACWEQLETRFSINFSPRHIHILCINSHKWHSKCAIEMRQAEKCSVEKCSYILIDNSKNKFDIAINSLVLRSKYLIINCIKLCLCLYKENITEK